MDKNIDRKITQNHTLEFSNTAVLFLIFNRLNTTKIVLDAIRDSRPSRIYIASDGPRDFIDGESEKVDNIRDYVVKNIDWDCKVKTLFRNENLGCKVAVSGAIDWFFKHEEMGIILEDDCLPSSSFFKFCHENLIKYKMDLRVSGISGSNFDSSLNLNHDDSYFFSEILYMWGWATWKRSWKLNKFFSDNYDNLTNKGQVDNVIRNKVANKKWLSESSKSIKGHIDTWDYQWLFANICHHKLAIYPSENLIKNIGFDENATHTKHVRDELIVSQKEIAFPLSHPNLIIRNNLYDQFFYSNIYGWASIKTRIINKIKKILNLYK